MKKTIAILVIAGLLSGCSTIKSIESNLASPTTTQAIANVETVVRAVVCGLSAASIVYASSTSACALLGGTPQGTATVPVSAVLK